MLEVATALAERAGAATLRWYCREDLPVERKADASPLTQADLASQRIIVAGLTEAFPEIPILSEEGQQAEYARRREWERLWLVDPLDGTREFVNHRDEFTVNIALVEHGRPVLGVVHAPVPGVTYGGDADGAWKRHGGVSATIRAARWQPGGELVVAASRSHAGASLEALLARLPAHRCLAMGSSLKLCLVAEGAAHLYPRLGPTMEWDTAAAHAVVTAAGGRVSDPGGVALRYNKRDLRNPHFVVSAPGVPWQEWMSGAS